MVIPSKSRPAVRTHSWMKAGRQKAGQKEDEVAFDLGFCFLGDLISEIVI